LRAAAHEDARQAAEEIGLRTGGDEGEPHPARRLDDAGGDFQEPEPQRRELAVARSRTLGMASRTASINQ
jgi:hypothetical protein